MEKFKRRKKYLEQPLSYMQFRNIMICFLGFYITLVLLVIPGLQQTPAIIKHTNLKVLSVNGSNRRRHESLGNQSHPTDRNVTVLHSRKGDSQQKARYSISKVSSEHVHFYKLKRSLDIFFYSAFYDTRKKQQPCVRILAIWPNRQKAKWAAPKIEPVFYCKINKSHGRPTTVIRASLYELNEHHNSRYSGFILTCNVTSFPEKVTVMLSSFMDDGEGAQLTVIPVHHRLSPTVNFTMCVPPLFGAVKPARLVEFVELSKLLGAQKIDFYIYEGQHSSDRAKNISSEVFNVLKHYKDKGIARLHHWHFPLPYSSMWYYGQVASLHDCLYKNIGRTRYVVFNDIDEFIIPRENYTSWQEMLSEIDDGQHSGYQVKMTYIKLPKLKEPLLSSTRRTADISQVRTKCIVRPERIFEMGIHHISKQNEERYKAAMLPAQVALVYHFRACNPKFSFNCKLYTNERDLDRYRNEWFNHTNTVLSELGLRRYFLIQ